jgi:hypothetical protein
MKTEVKRLLWVLNPGVVLRVGKSRVVVNFKFEKGDFEEYFEATMKRLQVDPLVIDYAGAQGVPPPEWLLRALCSLLEEKIAACAKPENGVPKL